MERKFLKDLGIEAETVDKIMDEHGKATNQLKDQLAKKKDELKTVEQERNEYKSQVDNNQYNEDKVNALQSKYDDALEKIDNYEQQLNVQSLEKDIIKRIPDAYDTDDVLTLLNRDKFERDDDGNVTNLDDVINAFKEAKPNLFTGAQSNQNEGVSNDDAGSADEQDKTETQPQRYDYRSGYTKGNPKGEVDHEALGKELAQKFGKSK